jgi:hypothetical protein
MRSATPIVAQAAVEQTRSGAAHSGWCRTDTPVVGNQN